MTALLSPSAKQQFFDNAGNPAAGYKLYTYLANTTTPQATYSNRAGTVANANPVVLDARGEAIIYLTAGVVYDYVLKTADDAVVWTREDVIADASADADLVNYLDPGTGAAAMSLDKRIRGRAEVNVLSFIDAAQHAAIAAGTSTYNAAPDIQKAIDAVASLGGGVVFFPKGVYRIASTLLVSVKDTWLVGLGGGYIMSGQANIRASAVTRIEWDPAVVPASGTPMVRFAIPSGGNYISGGGIREMMLDGNTVCPVGLNLRSWNRGTFDRMTAFACTEDQYLLDNADYALVQSQGAAQHNRFNDCLASVSGGTGWYLTTTANGWRFKGGSSFQIGDASINTLIGCRAQMALGNAYVLENCGQNCFINCWGGPDHQMATPVNDTHVVVVGGGTLAAGTYYYRVAAINANTGEITAASTETSIVVPSGTNNRVQVKWLPVTGATHYKIYGRSSGAELYLGTVASNFNYFFDTGATPSGAIEAARPAFGVILGSTDQATNTGAAGVARHHTFITCEMTFFARASQNVGGSASFGNMIYGLSNGDNNVAPVVFEAPTGNTDVPQLTYTTSGARNGPNTPALGHFGEVQLDQAFGNTADAGPFLYLNRRVTAVNGQKLGEMRWRVKNAGGVDWLSGGRIASAIDFATLGSETATMSVYPMYNGVDTQAAISWRNGVCVPDGVTGVTMQGFGTVNVSAKYYIANTQVVGPRATGWTAGTGTANKGAFAAYAGATMSAAYVQAEAQATNNAARDASQRIKAIEDALRTHGLIN